jgi:hypothetical protein
MDSPLSMIRQGMDHDEVTYDFFSSYISLDIFVDVENGWWINCLQDIERVTS